MFTRKCAICGGKTKKKDSQKQEGRGGDVPYAEALVLGKTIPPQDSLKCLLDGVWVNSLKVDARLRSNSSAY